MKENIAGSGTAIGIATLMGFLAVTCSGGKDPRPGDSALSPTAQEKPAIMRAVVGIPGWTRTGDVETYTKDGLYGYIDGGAEIVFQYGFRELAVFKFKPAAAAAPPAQKELVLEIYLMETGDAAFGIYSTKLEGDEESWPGTKAGSPPLSSATRTAKPPGPASTSPWPWPSLPASGINAFFTES